MRLVVIATGFGERFAAPVHRELGSAVDDDRIRQAVERVFGSGAEDQMRTEQQA